MTPEREAELMARLAEGGGPFAEASMINPASAYTCSDRFAVERDTLFRGMPNLVGLTCECTDPGDYLTADLGGVPVFVVRGQDGVLRGFVNACRHRGAPVVEGEGAVGNITSCQYHGWQYGLDGALRRRPGGEDGFDDVPKDTCSLHPVEIAEGYGLIFARAAGNPFTIDEALGGAEEEIRPYGLETYHHFETRVQEVPFNWKLVMDTFTEAYHLNWLHPQSLAPYFHADKWLFDAYGPHGRLLSLHKSVDREFEKNDPAERRILPHGTTQYLLLPNALLCHQLDHVELWRYEPLSVDRTRLRTSLFSPEPAETEKTRGYWTKNLDLLMKVTGDEDFTLMAKIQRNLASGALPEVVYGKIEPALIHFHRSVNDRVGSP